jgi:hypothetical protein
MARIPEWFWLPEANTLFGLVFYSFISYLIILVLGWLFDEKFDYLTDYRKKRIENREVARAAAKAKQKRKQAEAEA